MTVQLHSLDVERFTIPIRIYGEGQKYLICVNGAQQSMGVWKPLAHFLGEAYSVVAFDMPGQGKSTVNTGSMKIDFDEQVRCLASVAAYMKQSSFSVFGSSWGGLVAAAFAATNPRGLERLILASFGARPTEKIVELIKRGQEFYQNGHYSEIGQLLIEGFGQRVPELLKRATLKQFETISPEHLVAFQEHCEFVLSLQGKSLPIDFKQITAHTFIINGSEDAIIDFQDNLAIAQQIPSCQTRLVDEAGHFLHFERAEIMQYYRDFLS